MDSKATSNLASLSEADFVKKVSYDSLETSVVVCVMLILSALVARLILSGQPILAYSSELVILMGAFVPTVVIALIVNRWGITVSNDEISWNGLRSQGRLKWDEIKSASESSIGGLSLQIEAESGSYRVPLKGLKNLGVIRDCFADRGLLLRAELPYAHSGASAPYRPFLLLLGGGALLILFISVWNQASTLSYLAVGFLFEAISKVFFPASANPAKVTENQLTKWNWRGMPVSMSFSDVKRAWQDSDTGELTLWSPERELTLDADTPGFKSLIEHILKRVPPEAVKR